MKKFSFCFSLLLTFAVTFLSNVKAQSFVPSQAQIQQFKNLPRAQQEQLAKQMGFDVSMLDSLASGQQNEAKSSQPEFVERKVDNKLVSQSLSKQSVVKESTQKLVPFGYDIFEGRAEAVKPTENIPVPSNYIIGPGDSVKLQLFGKETGDYELTVNNEGNIDLPELGPLRVTGTSFQELKGLVNEKYDQQKIGVSPFVHMGKIRTIQVFLAGEVYRPGPLTIGGLSTVTTALINSGGVNEIGSLRNIELKRGGETVANFDLYDLIARGDTSNDIRLEQGDVLFVPTVKNIVSVDGQVRRPAIYEIIEGETVNDLLALAGGLLPNGDANSLQLVRKDPARGLSIFSINANDKTAVKTKLANGDFLRIPESSLEFTNAILISGAINMPSVVANTGLDLSKIVTEDKLYSNTDLNYALVVRKGLLNENSTIVQFKPLDVLTREFDLKLKAFDQLVFFNKVVKNVAAGIMGQVADGNLQRSQDDIKTNQANYLQKIESERFTSDSFARPSGKRFSRKELLSPIIAKLKSEASDNQPVQLVEIIGEVRYPGIYPLSNKASLGNMIDAAGGFTESAYLDSAEVTRIKVLNDKLDVKHKRINIHSELLLPENQQIQLQSKDVLRVARIPQWYESNNILLQGEVVFPGTYQIKSGETLSNVIQRAGGLTDLANPNAAVFTRKELAVKESRNIDKAVEDLRQQLANNALSNSQYTRSVDYQTANQVLDDLSNTKPVGRMVINFEAILAGSPSADIVLKNGDKLIIPNVTPAVTIIGEVFVSVTYRYDSALSIDDYLQLAGGVKEYGDSSRIYIVRANGAVFVPKQNFWFSGSSDNFLEPGDTIVVPRDVTNYDNIGIWQGVTQIIYQTAVALAAVSTF